MKLKDIENDMEIIIKNQNDEGEITKMEIKKVFSLENVDYIYEIFNNENLSVGEKKKYLYKKVELPNYPKKKREYVKDKIWERWNGDKGFVNTSLYDNNTLITVEDILG